jgi:hypothetical protein
MDAKTVKAISNQVYRRFPEVKDSLPKVRLQPKSKTGAAVTTYLLTFSGTALTANGKPISRHVRVVADADGNILKMTTSR